MEIKPPYDHFAEGIKKLKGTAGKTYNELLEEVVLLHRERKELLKQLATKEVKYRDVEILDVNPLQAQLQAAQDALDAVTAEELLVIADHERIFGNEPK